MDLLHRLDLPSNDVIPTVSEKMLEESVYFCIYGKKNSQFLVHDK